MFLRSKFFERDRVDLIARELIGKMLLTNINEQLTGGIITETEAYAGVVDKASHAYGGRRTKRTEVMYMEAGTVYVYLCYGLHSLFNIVTNQEDIPHAILIRSVLPVIGIEKIRERRRTLRIHDDKLCSGPGNLSKGLGISLIHNGIKLNEGCLSIEECEVRIPPKCIRCGPRIGIDYAEEDASLPYRFYVSDKDLVKAGICSR
jgi:DNA-3-methyladenine glycosylase